MGPLHHAKHSTPPPIPGCLPPRGVRTRRVEIRLTKSPFVVFLHRPACSATGAKLANCRNLKSMAAYYAATLGGPQAYLSLHLRDLLALRRRRPHIGTTARAIFLASTRRKSFRDPPMSRRNTKFRSLPKFCGWTSSVFFFRLRLEFFLGSVMRVLGLARVLVLAV